MATENSEVSPVDWLVVGALTTCPAGTFFLVLKVKLALPLPSVVTLCWPINFLPSPLLDEASFVGLPKNCKVNVMLAVLLSVPLMVV